MSALPLVPPLEGRRTAVTGAAGGIGRAVVDELFRGGACVFGLDREDPTGVAGARCDLRVDEEVRAAFDLADRHLGGLDALVNIAGGSGRSLGDGPVDVLSDAAWDFVLDTNLRSTFLACRAAIPRLGRGAAIVNVSSVLGLVGGAEGLFDTHAYAAAKGGIVALTRAMAASYAPRGIRVNAVAPGLVRTPMTKRAAADEAVMAEAAARQPLVGPFLEPAQVAAAVAFLAGASASGITGVVLPVDGGWTAS